MEAMRGDNVRHRDAREDDAREIWSAGEHGTAREGTESALTHATREGTSAWDIARRASVGLCSRLANAGEETLGGERA